MKEWGGRADWVLFDKNKKKIDAVFLIIAHFPVFQIFFSVIQCNAIQGNNLLSNN